MVAALQANKLAVGAGIDGLVVPAIRELSFDLEPGKILGLVGESGAGKSMVGRAIALLLPPGFAITAGTLAFEGNDLLQMAQAQRRALLGRAIAFIPQAPLTALNPVLTIGAQFDEHLARFDGAGSNDRRRRALAMLDAAQLPQANELLRRYPHQLSGGMCQRVLIAMAFASNPHLVIADEPTTALDVTMHAPIIRLIADMQRQHGTAVIFITHDLRLAAQICDDVIVMYAGRAIESGPARAVLTNPAHPYTRCLQLANPSMRADRRALHVMPEQTPSLRQLAGMAGCHFAPRCPLAAEECRRSEPPEFAISAGRRVAPLPADEQLPRRGVQRLQVDRRGHVQPRPVASRPYRAAVRSYPRRVPVLSRRVQTLLPRRSNLGSAASQAKSMLLVMLEIWQDCQSNDWLNYYPATRRDPVIAGGERYDSGRSG